MSLLVSEYSQVLHRVLCLAPSKQELQKLFEGFGDELSTSLGLGQKLDLRIQQFSGEASPLHYWVSFTLGQRGKLSTRVSLLGLVVGESSPSSAFWNVADAYLIWAPGSLAGSDAYFRLPNEEFIVNKPCLVGGIRQEDVPEKATLREIALVEHFRRNFKKLRFDAFPPTFLRSGLEWVLSF